MIGNIFPNMELIWRKNDDTKRSGDNAYNTYTPPRGCAPTREGAAGTTAPDLCTANGNNSFFRMESESGLVNIWKGI